MDNNSLKNVVIFGSSEYTEKYISLLKTVNINVAQIVDQKCYENIICNQKIISFEMYQKKYDNLKNIPVIITDTSNCGKKFIDLSSDLANIPGRHIQKILHPSFLVDYIDLTFPEKIYIFACNRSGSTLLFTILQKILDKYSSKKSTGKEKFFEELCRDHFQATMEILDRIFTLDNIYFTTTGVTSFRGIDYMGCREKEFFYISPIKSNRYIFDKIHRSCSLPDKNMITSLKEKGITIFSTIRNPLDIIVSNAFEVEYMYSKMFADESLDEIESGFRISYGERRLKNLDWFEGAAKFVYEYYDELLKYKDDIIFVKYEDVIEHPVETIRGIASIFGINMKKDDIISLWDKIAFKPLKQHKSHMFRPGADKWKFYLTKTHIDILKKLKFKEIIDELGYQLDLTSENDFSIYGKNDFSDENKLNQTLSIGGHINNIAFGIPICFSCNDIVYSNVTNQSLSFKYITNSSDFSHSCNKLFSYKAGFSCLTSIML